MQPFERLRSIARWRDGDERALVLEACDCLAGFADDPAGLVVACRRLLAHHPANGALWWLCARVLTAPDPAAAAWGAWRLVGEDATPERLAERLPFPHDDPVAVLGWPELSAAALTTRPDLDAVAVRLPRHHGRTGPRLHRADSPVRVLDRVEAAAAEPSHALAEALAVGSGHAVVPVDTADVLDELGAPAWLVAGTGRVLPDRLFASLRHQLDARDAPELEVVSVERFQWIVGPAGLDAPAELGRRVDCPIAPELLRLA